jgi:hypothetical protein
MTTLTLEQTKKEKKKATTAKWRADNPEKAKATSAKWRADNPEKVSADRAAYYVNHPTVSVINGMALRFKISSIQLREIVPQELIELKLLQLTLHRLIQEKRKLK